MEGLSKAERTRALAPFKEAATAELARRVDIKAAAVRKVDGRNLSIQRNVIGKKEMYELGEGEFLSFQDEFAKQRVFRAWLGDADGHFHNLVRSKDGELWQIDFDRVNLEGEFIELAHGVPFDGDPKGLVKGAVGFALAGLT